MSDRITRTRNFSLITYLPEEAVLSVIRANISSIRHWAYCLHDHDVKDDGTPQELHIHVMLNLNSAKTESAVRKMFPKEYNGEKCNTLSQVVHDLDGCFEYLTHDNEKSKYKYPKESVQCDDLTYWQSQIAEEDTNKALLIISDILDGESLWVLLKRYGREFVIHRDQYVDFARLVREERFMERRLQEEREEEKKRMIQCAVEDIENVFDD